MIHAHNGKQTPQRYGTAGQAIRSIDRRHLNETLLTGPSVSREKGWEGWQPVPNPELACLAAAEAFPNVTLHFQHKLKRADPTTNRLVFIGSVNEG
jgi:hypothetical protein